MENKECCGREKHKHYQCIRAFADGWKITVKIPRDTWIVTDHPSFAEDDEFRIVPDAEDWLPWYATEDSKCPVDGDVLVEVEFKDGVRDIQKAEFWYWGKECSVQYITRYRIVKEHKTPRAKRTLVKTIKVFSDGSTEEL